MAVVLGVWVALVIIAIHLDSFIDTLSSSVHGHSLTWITNAEVFLIFASIELNKCTTIPAIETGMLSGAEFVEFINDIVKLVSKRMEDDSELSLLFLHVHEQTEERWDQMVLSTIEQNIVHLTFLLNASLFCDLGRVIVIFLFIHLLGFLIFFLWHAAIFTDAQLLSCTLGQAQGLKHFLELVLEFGSGTSRLRELSLQLASSLPIITRTS